VAVPEVDLTPAVIRAVVREIGGEGRRQVAAGNRILAGEPGWRCGRCSGGRKRVVRRAVARLTPGLRISVQNHVRLSLLQRAVRRVHFMSTGCLLDKEPT